MATLTPTGRDSRTLRWDEPAPLGLREADPRQIKNWPGGRLWVAQSGKQNHYSVIATIDGGSAHVSIAHSQRLPNWNEILAVRAWGFHEETEVVMVLARKSEYVNLHENCMHLWESACGREGR